MIKALLTDPNFIVYIVLLLALILIPFITKE